MTVKARASKFVSWATIGVVSLLLSWNYLLYWRQDFHPFFTFLAAFLYLFPLAILGHLGLSRWIAALSLLSLKQSRRLNVFSHLFFFPLVVTGLLGVFLRGVTLSCIAAYFFMNLVIIPAIWRDPEKFRRRKRLFLNLLCSLLLIMLVFISYYKFLRLEGYYLEGDVHHIGYSINLFLGRSITQGIFPLWNPYRALGVPSYANPTGLCLFPLYLVAAIFSGHHYGLYHFIILTYVIPIGAGGIGFFFLVKWLVRRRWIALITSVGYAFSGFAVQSTEPSITAALCWLPFIVLFGGRAFLQRRNALRYCVAAGVAYALAIITVYPTLWFATGLHLVLLAIIIALIRRGRGLVSIAVKLVAIIGLGCLLAVPYLIAVNGYMPYTTRGRHISYQRAVGQNALSPRSFITLWFPRTALWQNAEGIARGGGTENILDMSNFQAQGLPQRSVYITLPCLIFALIALVKWKRYQSLPLLLAGISFFYLFASLGGFGFLYEWFFYLLPVYSRARHAAMNRLFFIFYLLLLSAIGMRITFRDARDRFLDRILPWILGEVLVLLLCYWAYLQAAILPIFNSDLTLYSLIFSDTLYAILFIGGTLIFILFRRSRRYRGAIIIGLSVLVIFDALNTAHASHRLRMKKKITNYQDSLGAFRKDFSAVPNRRGRVKSRFDANWVHDFHFTSGNYELNTFPATTRPIRQNPVRYGDHISRLFRLYPRVQFLPASLSLVRLGEGGAETAYLNQRVEIPAWFNAGGNKKGEEEGKLKILWYAPNLARVRVETERGALLEMVDAFFPGWKAYLDGEEIHIFRVNYCFKGVFVPPGSHKVSFVFDPPAFSWSILISALVFCGAIIFSISRDKLDQSGKN